MMIMIVGVFSSMAEVVGLGLMVEEVDSGLGLLVKEVDSGLGLVVEEVDSPTKTIAVIPSTRLMYSSSLPCDNQQAFLSKNQLST